MAGIRAVLGDVPAEEISRALAHQHIRYSYPGAEWDPRTLFAVEEAAERISTDLEDAADRDGYRAVVEMTPVEAGRPDMPDERMPQLQKKGVSADDIEKILAGNPEGIFSIG
jgi:predicted metal-dependent phosphotriesterase family hydrolase